PELSFAIVAKVPAFVGSELTGLTAGFHPTSVPSSVANRKIAGAVVVPLVTGDAASFRAMFKTVPVGVHDAAVGSPGVGVVAKFCVCPLAIGDGLRSVL